MVWVGIRLDILGGLPVELDAHPTAQLHFAVPDKLGHGRRSGRNLAARQSDCRGTSARDGQYADVPLLAGLYSLLVMGLLEGMLHYPRFITLKMMLFAIIFR